MMGGAISIGHKGYKTPEVTHNGNRGLYLSHYMSSLMSTVRNVTWMSDQSLYSAKWMRALEQVTVRHLVKCSHQLTT